MKETSPTTDPRQILRQTSLDLRLRWADRRNHQRLKRIAQAVAAQATPDPGKPPVILFRASTGILRLSLNAAFGLLTAWGLRLSGIPVVHFTCQAGMNRCIQGLDRDDYYTDPPCRACVAQARRTYAAAPVHWFHSSAGQEMVDSLRGLSLEELAQFEHRGNPLGTLVMPSLRWALRRHHLPDDGPTRFLLRNFLISAAQVAASYSEFQERVEPQAIVVFNGVFFPEAIARWLARQHGVETIAYEVGFQPFSAFFTSGDATAYPIDIPPDFELSPEQDARLDAYLEERFQGHFTMAGIRFWPEMRGLDPRILEKAASFRELVPVFTNVVFDTSQVHANTVFPHMFAWLDLVLELVRSHPETLFVIRAHPDEQRSGKESRESVADWVRRRGARSLDNLVFIAPEEYISSYELIQRAKFVMVYNSSIGLEAALLGATVICAGQARYTRYPTAYLPDDPGAYRHQCEKFLKADNTPAPQEFRRHARRFMYYQLFRASLPFDAFLETGSMPGFVQLRDFDWQQLTKEHSPTMRTLVHGITHGGSFLLEDR